MIFTLLVFLGVLSVLVIAHEWGHFFAARKSGIAVDEFGIGFPPRLFSVKRGETLYSVNLIPLGGFVRLRGDAPEEQTDPHRFDAASAPRRFVVLVAGVAMNAVLAFVFLTIGFSTGYPTALEEDLPAHAVVHDQALVIAEVLPESPAARAGIPLGSSVQSINGQTFARADAARAFLQAQASSPILLLLQDPDGSPHEILLTSEFLQSLGREGLGIALVSVAEVSYPFPWNIVRGASETAFLFSATTQGLVGMFGNLFAHGSLPQDVSGPVGIAVMSGQAARQGLPVLLQFSAILSVNLALVNLLPLPGLDGGRLLFLGIEVLRRKRLSLHVQSYIHRAGLAFLLALVVAVTYRDLLRFFE